MEKECIVLAHRWINNNIEYLLLLILNNFNHCYWTSSKRDRYLLDACRFVCGAIANPWKVYESPRIGRWIETVSGLPMRVRARSPTLTVNNPDSSDPWMVSPHHTSPRYIPEYDAPSQETEESVCGCMLQKVLLK